MKVGNYEIKRKQAYKTSETYDNGIIMGIHHSERCPGRYATWEYTEMHANESISGEEVLNAFWGHYFDSEVEAYKDFYPTKDFTEQTPICFYLQRLVKVILK